jgi:[ribosomal protein S5]-alanine N-acetyltransferase
MIIPTLGTSDLTLRPWTLEDADALFRILQEPDILRYFPPTAVTLEKTQNYIKHQLDHWQERSFGHWAVVTQADDQVVGWNGLEYLPELDEVEVAYLLSRRVRGHGFATQVASAAVRFGFESTGLKKIIGLVHPQNAPSIRVLEKCGLVFTDRLTWWGLEMSRYQIKSPHQVG